MCGIFGQIRLDGAPADGGEIVTRGVELMRHRGPDGMGVMKEGPATLGHTRLAIIAVESGAQPMKSVCGRGVITFNGEIYNYREIRSELEKLGHSFATASDTEVLLNAYLRWGADCLHRLRGMFAFAALDLEKKRAIIARDRLGKKPLFHRTGGGSITFSSELEPLYKTIGPFKLSPEGLNEYLTWQYIHAPRTIYEGVNSLEPACFIDINLQTGETKKERYWRLRFEEDNSLSIGEWERKLDGLVRDAVDARLVSDVPFGAFLSGGVDSSLVVGYMADILKSPVRTFTAGFSDEKFNELPYARMAAETNHTEHTERIVEPEAMELLPLLVSRHGQPFADSSAIPTFRVSQMAREKVKMALTGDGGDESFAGYSAYEYIAREMSGSRSLEEILRGPNRLKLGFYYLRKWLNLAPECSMVDEAFRLHCGSSFHFHPDQRMKILRKERWASVEESFTARRGFMEAPGQPLISRLQNLDTMCYLPYDILAKVDTATMANSLEARVPLLDHKLVEEAAKIPAGFKLMEKRINGAVEYEKKWILRKLASKRYPESFLNRPKTGFGAPMAKWFSGPLKAEMERRLLKSACLPAYFDMGEIRGIVERHSETVDHSTKIWNLLFLEEWMRTHPEAL